MRQPHNKVHLTHTHTECVQQTLCHSDVRAPQQLVKKSSNQAI